MSEIILKSAVPILFVGDVSASAAFFREKLGFEINFLHGTPPFYSSVSRGEASLHLRCVRQPNFSELAAQEERDAGGKVVVVVLHQNGHDMRATHVTTQR